MYSVLNFFFGKANNKKNYILTLYVKLDDSMYLWVF